MDFCDVSLRVLYEFEYTTKYGRKIKITSGERLLLIKKTNDDWWQVIRNSEERPFFVPASYVEELEPRRNVQNKDQSSTKSPSEKIPLDKNPSVSSLPNEIRKHSLSSVSSNQGVEYTSNSSPKCLEEDTTTRKTNTKLMKSKVLSSTMSSSGYNSLCEEIQTHEEDTSIDLINSDNKNLYKRSDSISSTNRSASTSTDNKLDDVIANSPILDKELSDRVSMNTSGEIPVSNAVENDEEGKYTSVVNTKTDSGVSTRKIIPGLPASDSLENLSLQIELKTNSLRNNIDKKCEFSTTSLNKTNSFGSVSICENKLSRDPPFYVEDQSEQGLKIQHKSDSRSGELNSGGKVVDSPNLVINNNLLHHGSIKSIPSKPFLLKKSMSEKTLKNVSNFGKTNALSVTLIEENFDSFSSTGSFRKNETNNEIVPCAVAINNNTTCNKVEDVLQKSEFQEKMLQNRQCFGSDSQLSHLKTTKEKTTSRYSLDSVVEGEFRDGSNQDLAAIKHSSKDSSLVSVMSGKTNSEKSSNDSLLDIDIEGNFRKISGGTTSDSLVPTDGEDLVTSDSETDSVKLAKCKLEESKTGQKARKIHLTRRRRVFPSKSRLDLGLDPPSPVPQQTPSRVLGEGWSEYDTQDGRKFFYNVQTKEKRWKPPRRTQNASMENLDQGDGVGVGAEGPADDMFVVSLSLPSGWTSEIDPVSGQACYIHTVSKAKVGKYL